MKCSNNSRSASLSGASSMASARRLRNAGAKLSAKRGFERFERQLAEVDLQPVDAIDATRRAELRANRFDQRQQALAVGVTQLRLEELCRVARAAVDFQNLAHDLVLLGDHRSAAALRRRI
jgi:hypothetical protein